MNKNAFYALVLAVALVIVLPVIGAVNETEKNHATFPGAAFFAASPQAVSQPTRIASGSPAPPPTPPLFQQSILVASGSPAPPPTPPLLQQSILVASGSLAPPPTPKDHSVLLA
jgi:hypothetical protein